MSAADEIARGPQGGDDEFVQRYLGVPQGYAALRPRDVRGEIAAAGGDPAQFRGEAPPRAVSPRYTEADLYRPEGFGVEDRARLQQLMDRAGLFDRNDKYVLGRWDETTIGAYTRLLAYANRGGYDEREALEAIGTLSPEEYDEMYGKGAYARSSSKGVGGVTGPGTEADVPRGTVTQGLSGEDLRYLADRTARKGLGRKLTQEELDRFGGAYQAMLAQANQRQAAAQDQAAAGADATYAGPTDPEAFASAQLEKLDPVAFAARKQLDAFKTISARLAGLGPTTGGGA